MEPGYRSPLIDFFRRSDTTPDVRLLAAQGALSTSAHEQLALLVLLADDPDADIAKTAVLTIDALPAQALRDFLAREDVPAEMKNFFGGRGVTPSDSPAADASQPLIEDAEDDQDEDDDEPEGEGDAKDQPGKSKDKDGTPTLLAGLPVKKKMKLAFKGTREQRAQLIRDPNKIVNAAVLSSPKLTVAEVEAFAKMANVAEEVLRVIGMNRNWLKNYGTVLGLVKNPKTPAAISMQLLPRVSERDLKMLAMDRNVPEALKLAARKFVVKGLK
jgi:hypothetical protein